MLKKVVVFALFMGVFGTSQIVFAQKYRAVIKTEYGKVKMELYNNTPKHTANFVKLCKQHFYDGTLFHRVIPQFMIQGGDPQSKDAKPGQILGNGDVGYRIPAEFNQEDIHVRGALAAARDNNPEKASSGCQFYIVQGKRFTATDLEELSKRTGFKYTPKQINEYETEGGAPHLDGNYTIFGRVIKGMPVVDKIAEQKRDRNDRPDTDQRILKIRTKKHFLFFWL